MFLIISIILILIFDNIHNIRYSLDHWDQANCTVARADIAAFKYVLH
jgi:hypothetical protein